MHYWALMGIGHLIRRTFNLLHYAILLFPHTKNQWNIWCVLIFHFEINRTETGINVSARLSAFQNRYIKQLLKFLKVSKQFLFVVWCFGVQITDAKPVELLYLIYYKVILQKLQTTCFSKKLQPFISKTQKFVIIALHLFVQVIQYVYRHVF